MTAQPQMTALFEGRNLPLPPDIPTTAALGRSGLPTRSYRWESVPAEFTATLDARAWRLDGRLACYFSLPDGRRYQLSWDRETARRITAAHPSLEFDGPAVRLGERFLLRTETPAKARSPRWLDAVKLDLDDNTTQQQRVATRTANERIDDLLHRLGQCAEREPKALVPIHAGPLRVAGRTAHPEDVESRETDLEPEDAKPAPGSDLASARRFFEALADESLNGMARQERRPSCEIDLDRFRVQDYATRPRIPELVEARLDARVLESPDILRCCFTTREGWTLAFHVSRDASGAFVPPEGIVDFGSPDVRPGDRMILTVASSLFRATITRATVEDAFDSHAARQRVFDDVRRDGC